MITQPTKDVIERVLELGGSTFDGLMKGLRLLRYRHGLVAFQARFHHAAFVMISAFLSVLVAEMNLNAADMFREVPQRVFHHGFGVLGHRFISIDRVVCINLYFQDNLLLFGLNVFIPCCVCYHFKKYVTR
jgi:hypothetical protein